MEQGLISGDHVARALETNDLAFADYPRALRRAGVGRELALERQLAAMLYQPGDKWREWMALVLFDPDVLEMYAARVSGSQVLADQKLRPARAMLRHVIKRRGRQRELAAAMVPGSETGLRSNRSPSQ